MSQNHLFSSTSSDAAVIMISDEEVIMISDEEPHDDTADRPVATIAPRPRIVVEGGDNRLPATWRRHDAVVRCLCENRSAELRRTNSLPPMREAGARYLEVRYITSDFDEVREVSRRAPAELRSPSDPDCVQEPDTTVDHASELRELLRESDPLSAQDYFAGGLVPFTDRRLPATGRGAGLARCAQRTIIYGHDVTPSRPGGRTEGRPTEERPYDTDAGSPSTA